MGGVVHGHEQALAIVGLPAEGDESIVPPVFVPGRLALQELPPAIAYFATAKNGEQPLIEPPEPFVDGLFRCTNGVSGQPAKHGSRPCARTPSPPARSTRV